MMRCQMSESVYRGVSIFHKKDHLNFLKGTFQTKFYTGKKNSRNFDFGNFQIHFRSVSTNDFSFAISKPI